jgi:hypothetical protein
MELNREEIEPIEVIIKREETRQRELKESLIHDFKRHDFFISMYLYFQEKGFSCIFAKKISQLMYF